MQDWITNAIDSMGYLGVVLLMFFENLFPPIPSEVVMPLSGYTAAEGELSLVGVIAAGTLGSVLGAIFWYYIARWFGEERLKAWTRRHGRWITLGPREVEKADRWFDRHGQWLVLLGRLVPTVRTLIAIPAGFFEMPIGRYLVFTTIGTTVWTGALAGLGFWLGKKWTNVGEWLQPATYVIIGVIVVVYIYRVITFDRSQAKGGARTTGTGTARRR